MLVLLCPLTICRCPRILYLCLFESRTCSGGYRSELNGSEGQEISRVNLTQTKSGQIRPDRSTKHREEARGHEEKTEEKLQHRASGELRREREKETVIMERWIESHSGVQGRIILLLLLFVCVLCLPSSLLTVSFVSCLLRILSNE